MPNAFRRRNFFATTGRTITYGLLFALFVFIGTVFYTYFDSYGWAVGLYYAVGMAFQLGFTYGSGETTDSQVFTIFYMTVGAIAFEVITVFFAKLCISYRQKWHATPLSKVILERHDDEPYCLFPSWTYLVDEFRDLVNISLVAIALFGIGIWYSVSYLEYDIVYSLYFVVSTVMGVGVVDLSIDNSKNAFTLTAVYSMVSVMVFSVLVLAITELMLTDDPVNELEVVKKERVLDDELILLARAGSSEMSRFLLCFVC
jgi:hypothetical protein